MKNTIAVLLLMGMILFGALPAYAGQSFTDNGDGTITDNVTTLMWQKQDNATGYTWANALTYCKNLSLGGYAVGSWRLPNVKELKSIVDFTKYAPAINGTYFPGTKSSYYWSSTTYAVNTTLAWFVGFDGGYTGDDVRAVACFVRCVR
jgi:hypothetical protein